MPVDAKHEKCYNEVNKPAFKRFMELKKTLDECSTIFDKEEVITAHEGNAGITDPKKIMAPDYKKAVVELLSEILNRNKVITDYKKGARFPPPPPGPPPPGPPRGGGSSSGGSKKKKKKHKKKSKKKKNKLGKLINSGIFRLFLIKKI